MKLRKLELQLIEGCEEFEIYDDNKAEALEETQARLERNLKSLES